MSATPPTVVESGDFTYESSTSSAAEMIRTLKSDDPKGEAPKEIKRDGKSVKQPDPVSDAASTLGKKGAEVAAKARKAAAKEAPEPAAKPEKAAETKAGEAEGANTDDEDTYDTPELKARAAETVQKATRTAAEAKREASRERERAERAERALEEARRPAPAREERPTAEAKPAERQAQPAADDDPEPEESQFEDYKDFVKAAGAHSARQVIRAHEQKRAQEAQEGQRSQFIHRAIGSFTGRITEASEADESFLERTADIAQALQPSFTMAQGQRPTQLHVLSDEIIKSEHGPGLMLHFAENPEDFERVKALPSREAIIRAVTKIEARLEDAIAGNPPSTERPGSNPEFSKAKPPARPVAVSPRIANAEPGADASLDDHIDFHNARDKEKRRRSA